MRHKTTMPVIRSNDRDAPRVGRAALTCLAIGALLTACAARETAMPDTTVDVRELIGSEWIAESVGGAGVIDRVRSTLRFASATQVDGDTACNRFTGPLVAEGQTVRFGPLATTRRACPPAVMDQERRYLQALGRGGTLGLDGAVLTLVDEARQPLVRFTRLAPQAR